MLTVLIGLVNTNAWLQHVLMEGTLSIKRLQKLFGVVTEKPWDFKDKVDHSPNPNEAGDEEKIRPTEIAQRL